MVEHGVDVRPESVPCDGRRASKRGERGLRCDELARAKRDELADGHAISCYDERLSAIECAHDLAAAVAELTLGDLSGHDANCSTRAT